jgi:hypothetical protein
VDINEDDICQQKNNMKMAFIKCGCRYVANFYIAVKCEENSYLSFDLKFKTISMKASSNRK